MLTVLVFVPLSRSHILMVRSWDPVKRLLVTKLNLHAFICSLCPEKVWRVRIVLSFQRMALCSVEAPARNSLSMEMEISVIDLVKPRRV